MSERPTPIADAFGERLERAAGLEETTRVAGDAVDKLEEIERENAELAETLRKMIGGKIPTIGAREVYVRMPGYALNSGLQVLKSYDQRRQGNASNGEGGKG